jgi:hypothetical protein
MYMRLILIVAIIGFVKCVDYTTIRVNQTTTIRLGSSFTYAKYIHPESSWTSLVIPNTHIGVLKLSASYSFSESSSYTTFQKQRNGDLVANFSEVVTNIVYIKIYNSNAYILNINMISKTGYYRGSALAAYLIAIIVLAALGGCFILFVLPVLCVILKCCGHLICCCYENAKDLGDAVGNFAENAGGKKAETVTIAIKESADDEKKPLVENNPHVIHVHHHQPAPGMVQPPASIMQPQYTQEYIHPYQQYGAPPVNPGYYYQQ